MRALPSAGPPPALDPAAVTEADAALARLRWDGAGWASLPAAFGPRVAPTPLANARLVAWSEDAARLVGLDGLAPAARAALVGALGGERPLPPGAAPLAMAYAGHQFGVWVPRLGDGRALLLGEVTGAGDTSWDLHLKGAGPTPFARGFDGRCVLRAAVRELVGCEALDALGVPTARGLLVATSDTVVARERPEPGALVLRLAPSHARVGSVEWAAEHHPAHLAALLDHVLARDLPALAGAPRRFEALLAEVVGRSARLAADWHALGFVHGVLNTDNLSLLGLTLDLGPFAFLEAFDPAACPNHSDPAGRYAFDRQPEAVLWGLAQLARALRPLVPLEVAADVLEGYAPAFADRYTARMAARLGLARWEGDDDAALLDELLGLLAAQAVDLPLALRRLATYAPGAANARLRELFVDPAAFDAWAARWWARVTRDGEPAAARRARMDAANPRVVPRAHHLQRAIDAAAAGDASVVAALLDAVRRPFDDDPALDPWAEPPPRDAPPVVLSCSS